LRNGCVRGLMRAPPLRDRPGLTLKFSVSSLAMLRRLTSKRAYARAKSIDRIRSRQRIAERTYGGQSHPRTLREPSLKELKSKTKFRRAAAHHLAQCRSDGVARCKIQCADKPLRPKGASERQFALSSHQAVGGLRLSRPALSFAKPPSDKNQDKQNASRFRADLAQLIPRVLVDRRCSSSLLAGRGQNAGAAAVAPVVSNLGAGRSQADRSNRTS
jgi:hypothetical protein